MNKLISLICSALVACALIPTTSGYVTSYRSVKHCIDRQVTSDEQCDDACLNRSPNNSSSKLAIKYFAEFKTNADGNQQCCCKYDDAWELSQDDDWEPFEDNKVMKTSFRLNLYVIWDNQPPCSPKRAIFIKDKQETEAYKNMCKYVPSPEPMSMLELAEFIDSVSYLRELPSRNPLVSWKLGRLYIPNFTSDLKQQFADKIDLLLDHSRNFRQAEGPPFEVEKMETMSDVTSRLRLVFDNAYVHRAFDELIISIVIINIINAEKWLMNINDKSMSRKLFHSLRNNGDYVDPKIASVKGFDCKTFKEARDIATNLNDTSRSVLSRLNSPGAYNAMTREWRPMMTLKESIEVYDNLIAARCTDIDKNNPLFH